MGSIASYEFEVYLEVKIPLKNSKINNTDEEIQEAIKRLSEYEQFRIVDKRLNAPQMIHKIVHETEHDEDEDDEDDYSVYLTLDEPLSINLVSDNHETAKKLIQDEFDEEEIELDSDRIIYYTLIDNDYLRHFDLSLINDELSLDFNVDNVETGTSCGGASCDIYYDSDNETIDETDITEFINMFKHIDGCKFVCKSTASGNQY